MIPSDRFSALLKGTHESSGHVGADRTLRLFKQWFHTTWTDDQLRKTLQPIVDKCPCRFCKPGDIRDRGLYSTLPIPHCANSVLYMDYTEMPKFGGYDFALVVTCGLTRFTRVFPCTKHITGEETIKVLLEEWFCAYGAPKEINSDEDVRVRSDTGWYKRVLTSLDVPVFTGIPYSHTTNPLCERQIRVLKENVRMWCKAEHTRDWVRLLPVICLMMNSQESSSTGYSPHELFPGRPAWFLHAPYPEDTHSSVGEWGAGAASEGGQGQGYAPESEGASVEQQEPAKGACHLPRGGLGAGAPQLTTRLATLYQRGPPTSDPTRFYLWRDTVSQCGHLPV